MRTAAALAGSAAFLIAAPGIVAGLIPAAITGWHLPAEGGVPTVLGLAVTAAAAMVLLHAFARFALDGRGTPAPVAPTESLVVTGLYRHVRNPMYLAVIAMILGQALAFRSPGVLAWGVIAGAAMIAFATLYEEDALERQHGAAFRRYRAAVPGWWPRLAPWTPDAQEGEEWRG